MDFTRIVDAATTLRSFYPELRLLFPTAAALAKALDLLLSPNADPEALRQLWLSQTTESTVDTTKARDDYRKLAALNEKRGAWLYGGRKQLKEEKDAMLRHVHKLRSLPSPASFELVEKITGISTKCARSWYSTWLKKQDQSNLKRWASEASSYKDDWKRATRASNDGSNDGSNSADNGNDAGTTRKPEVTTRKSVSAAVATRKSTSAPSMRKSTSDDDSNDSTFYPDDDSGNSADDAPVHRETEPLYRLRYQKNEERAAETQRGVDELKDRLGMRLKKIGLQIEDSDSEDDLYTASAAELFKKQWAARMKGPFQGRFELVEDSAAADSSVSAAASTTTESATTEPAASAGSPPPRRSSRIGSPSPRRSTRLGSPLQHSKRIRSDSVEQTTTTKRPRAAKASKKPDSAVYVGGDVLRGDLHVHKYSREFKIPSARVDEILAMEKVILTKDEQKKRYQDAEAQKEKRKKSRKAEGMTTDLLLKNLRTTNLPEKVIGLEIGYSQSAVSEYKRLIKPLLDKREKQQKKKKQADAQDDDMQDDDMQDDMQQDMQQDDDMQDDVQDESVADQQDESVADKQDEQDEK
ncbi:hypothetical protein PHYSODRAFT_342437 [Phytophthora sojae]|uniref:Uncharacterized protein n=1 Tax=Phytophthora sojae (strain P6497) TaxID=1094619 RepID=G5AGI2_PHYSP|nr:hypothetical protein PHYSODRAFT_342437 [Phytophthora sojae]EGZ05262.1 hypothetical protein PHYSODRAFT_342437 [Phytophthora sojae]|eukprot:XP_009539183.1 hypothetical protein PHYSODRAFT_342437 [Phytophthora sojae]